MVPGVNVARITTSTWGVSIRGFNDRYVTKVLVLIDGVLVVAEDGKVSGMAVFNFAVRLCLLNVWGG